MVCAVTKMRSFVNTGDEVETLLPQVDFEPQQIVQPLSLSSILSPTLANLLRHLMRAVSGIALKRFDKTFRHGPRPIDVTLLQFGN